MKASLKIYSECKIVPWKNFAVDVLHEYLATLSNTYEPTDENTIKQIQYFKHDLKTSIKVNLPELNAELGAVTGIVAKYNYLEIQNNATDTATNMRGKFVYYFITDKKMISENCVEFQLEMDVLNTFKFSELNFSPRTTIMREHKNRWKNATEEGLYTPLIDFYNEGINPILFKKKEYTLYNETMSGEDIDEGKYYLVYKSESTNADSPLHLYLCGNVELQVAMSTISYTGHIDLSGATKNIIIYANDGTGGGTNEDCTIYFSYKSSVFGGYNTIEVTFSSQYEALVCTPQRIDKIRVGANGSTILQTWKYNSMTSRRFDRVSVVDLFRVRYLPSNQVITSITANMISTWTYDPDIPDTQGNYTLNSISDIDRTNPLLLKIVELPYRPLDLDFNEQGVIETLPDGWVVSTTENMLMYSGRSLMGALRTELVLWGEGIDEEEWLSPFEDIGDFPISVFGNVKVNRSMFYETKLQHSEFGYQKFVYDSFAYIFRNEYLETGDLQAQSFYLDFSVTLTMNSKFMFEFRSWKEHMKIDDQDYSAMLYIARNNEVPIFNSAYLNYIRTGYNYDIKTRNRELRSSIIGAGLSYIGAAASFVSSIYTGGVGVAGGIALGTSAIAQTYNIIEKTAQNDQNIAQKLKQSEMQGLSVIGSDDVDLMSEYTYGNKAKICIYSCSDKMRKAMFDLFYYFGYIANYQGVPVIDTRQSFNFVQCEPVFEQTGKIPSKYVEAYAKKCREGITFLHQQDDHIGGQLVEFWDFEQKYENWEVL